MITFDLDELFETAEGDEFKLPFNDLRHQFPDTENKSEFWPGPGFDAEALEKYAYDRGWDVSGTFRLGSMVTFTRRRAKG